MSELRFEWKNMLAADLGEESCVPDLLGERILQNSLKFYLDETDEAQKIIADCGMIPSNTDYSTSDEYIQNHELEHKIVEFMQNNYTDLVADPNISQLGEISQIMLDAAQKMFSEQAADVQEEMDSAQKQVEEVMSRDAE